MTRTCRLLVPQALTSARLVLGAYAAGAAMDGAYETAATLICLGAVTDGLDGVAARRLGVTSPFGALYDYFADYQCYVFAPWAIARGLLDSGAGRLHEALLTIPLLTGALRYARNGLIVAGPSQDGQIPVPGLATVFFAFLPVAAVFLDAKGAIGESAFAPVLIVLTTSFSLLMVAPFHCPKIATIPGMSPAVLLLIGVMPFVATKTIAAAMFAIGLCYPLAARLYARAHQVR